MGNYTKSFNFRNGVQVDDSNFIVNPNGLVGIGTSLPEKKLDVRGNAKIIGDTRLVGLTSITDLNVVGVVTIGSIKVDSGSGIITATKFVGDASGLTNIVAIATDGFIANAGSLSTTAKIGIGSEAPTSQLDVLGDSKFVGVTTFAGITTVTGETLFTTQLNVSGVSTFVGITTVTGSTLFAKDVNISGVITATTFKGAVESTSLSSSGNVDFDANLDVDGTTDLDVLNVAEKAIFKDDVEFHGVGGISSITFDKSDNSLKFKDSAKAKFGTDSDFEIYHTGSDSIVENTTGQLALKSSQWGVQGTGSEGYMIYSVAGAQIQLYYAGVKKFETISTGASVYNQLNVASLDGGASGLSSHFGSLRYGNENGGESPYSTRRSLDLINTDSGNINYYLNANNLSIPDSGSDFHWHKGFDNATLMTLTNAGVLGIGITIPDSTKKLHVLGGSKITGVSTFNSDLFVGNDLNVKGSLTVSLVTASVTGNLTGNVNASSGLSTFSGIKVTDKTETNFAGVGIGTTCSNANYIETVNDAGFSTSKFIVNTEGKVAIGTDNIRDGIGLNAHKEKATFGAVGVGTTSPLAAVDFRDAGQDGVGVFANRMYMLPPQVNSSQRSGLSTVTGAVIFNTTDSKLQIYINNNWVNLH